VLVLEDQIDPSEPEHATRATGEAGAHRPMLGTDAERTGPLPEAAGMPRVLSAGEGFSSRPLAG